MERRYATTAWVTIDEDACITLEHRSSGGQAWPGAGTMVLASFFKRDIWALEKNNVAFADALRALRATHDES